MVYSQAKSEAYEKAEQAISALIDAFDSFDEGEMLTGWTIIVSGSRFSGEDAPNYEPTDDELDVTAHYCYHTKRGQDPTMTRGMIEAFLDKFRT